MMFLLENVLTDAAVARRCAGHKVSTLSILLSSFISVLDLYVAIVFAKAKPIESQA